MKFLFLLVLLLLVACSPSVSQVDAESAALSFVLVNAKFTSEGAAVEEQPEIAVSSSSKIDGGWDVLIVVKDRSSEKDAVLRVIVDDEGNVGRVTKIDDQ